MVQIVSVITRTRGILRRCAPQDDNLFVILDVYKRQLVDSMLASMGMEAEGMEMQLGDMTYTVQLKDGAVTSMQIAMQAAMEAEGVPMTMDMAMEMTVNATGDDVTVSIPDDLTGYTDLEDLMQAEA